MPCDCGKCGGEHTALELARRALALARMVNKANGPIGDNPIDPLTEDQALALSTAMSTWAALYQKLEDAYEYKHEINAAEQQQLAEAGAYATQHAMDLVTDANKARLTPVFDRLQQFLVSATSGGQSPNAAYQEAMTEFISRAYWAGEETVYTPYELERLVRTELAFAQGEATQDALVQEFDADTSLIDDSGPPPWHPNCSCDQTTQTGSDGREYVVGIPSDTACDECLGICEAMTMAVP